MYYATLINYLEIFIMKNLLTFTTIMFLQINNRTCENGDMVSLIGLYRGLKQKFS